MRILPLLLFMALSAALAVMLLHQGEGKPVSSIANSPLPAITVTTLDGKTRWNPKALEGRVTLINFYASWCSPCEEEMPELAALKTQFPALHFAGVAWNDDPKTLAQWLKKHKQPYDSLWIDPKGDATIDLGIKGIPESIIVDAKGMVRYRLAGALTKALRDRELDALIASLLKEAADAGSH